ncbi:MAG: 30S ribosomal protein S20 [Chloroflexota bacterium]|nr:30S ribosomal protein S20 [Chloroflexota bacterium]MDE2884306.1 30S ribosomal protein S20 [Chloroflexota bacterium]
MPAKKAARVQERRRIINRRVRSSTRTAVKKAVRALNGRSDTAGAAVLTAVSRLDRAVSKGIVHRNAAARSKSRLTKRLNATASE